MESMEKQQEVEKEELYKALWGADKRERDICPRCDAARFPSLASIKAPRRFSRNIPPLSLTAALIRPAVNGGKDVRG